MLIDCFASESHYAEHLLPIWRALDPSERGRFFHMGRLAPYLTGVLGLDPAEMEHGRPRGEDRLIVVASWQDYMMAPTRPVVLVNHGAGQSYSGDPVSALHGSYSGGDGRSGVVLNICPGEADAAVCRAAQPDVPAVAVGLPKLDYLHARLQARGRGGYTGMLPSRPRWRNGPTATVCVSFHFPLKLCPETFWAFPHYERALRALAQDSSRGFQLLGHGHPRAWAKLGRFYESIGIEPVERFAEVLERADVYVCDTSSTIYEFASTGRPVVVLNAPWYRRDVNHGLRFWEAAEVGVQVDEPEDLAQGIAVALEDPPDVAAIRDLIVSRIYSHTDGRAAERAVVAIRSVALTEPRPRRRVAIDAKRARTSRVGR